MKKILSLGILFLAIQWNVQAQHADSLLIKKAISEVQKRYAPDKRTAIFQVQIQDGSPLKIEVETTNSRAVDSLKHLLEQQKVQAVIHENLLPSKDLGDKIYGVANLSVSNNRVNPNHPAEMATQMILGTPVEILKKKDGYSLVRTPDGYISWTDNSGVAAMNKAAFLKWQQSEKVVVAVDYTYSYQQASAASMRVSDLVKGNILQVLGKEKDFLKVVYPDQRIAYVLAKDVSNYKQWVNRPNPDAAKILETAKTMLGVPYLWGGTSIKGVDCSGFTKTSFFLNGIVLPRDASQQALVGEKVDIYEQDTVSLKQALKNLKPGDLLFFAGGKNRTPNPRVTHTAIYMGNGEFIQSAGLVRINSMIPGAKNYDDYQSRTLVGARRMLTAVGTTEVTRIDHHPFYQTQP
ncbi:MAG TPA: SH3 domain-containing C40 family peptidase [Daejeonella sp.]|nr:SH3 domain-containing C40 family peptidase [Daejeonella sp.]